MRSKFIMHNSNQNYGYRNSYKSSQSQSKYKYSYRPRDNSESQNNWCETCDRGFYTKQLLEQHISEHQKCGIDGCKFVAHPNIVTKHIQMQHSTGLYNRIRNLETPEDIEKWINERKKNYPSKVNIEKKKNQQEECIDRGEKLQNKKSRFNKKGKGTYNRNNNKFSSGKNFSNKNSNKKPHFQIPTNNKITVPDVQIEEEEIYCGVRPFKGISKIIQEESIEEDELVPNNDNIEIEDDEWQDITENNSSLPICGALGNLLDAYKSSSEDEETALPLSCKSEILKKVTRSTTENKLCDVNIPLKVDSDIPKKTDHLKIEIQHDDDSDNGPEEVAIIRELSPMNIVDVDSNTTIDESCIKSGNKRTRNRKRKLEINIDNNKPETSIPNKEAKLKNRPTSTFERQLQYYKDRPSTLLEKLLEKEMRHERNVVLQCINHIVKNNFFDGNNKIE